MQISRAGEYGVLGLLHLARHAPNRTVMIEEVARKENIPRSFLAKIFQQLVRAGLIRSYRGASGGFALLKSSDAITVLEIIEAIEGKLAFQRCGLDEVDKCERVGGCALCGLYEQAQDRVKEVFARTTLADLLERQTPVGKAHRHAVAHAH